ncbi:MAG TPA: sigma-70 family RNA polymerase sigma factor [Chloroflexota bacterium]|jgi:RNA polymerase sigma-70 factor (ECF subfamily)|nr:sigma-70 family RNA polymerase sigma factor [Chloroflexota bacterium]
MAVSAQIAGIRLVEAGTNPREQLVGLIDRYESPLCGYLRVIVGDPDIVFDCAQDSFLRAYEHLSKGRSVNSQWLYKVARNRAIDHIRHRDRIDRDPEVLEQLTNDEQSPSYRTRQVRLVLAELPLADRELLYLSIVDRFKTEEIGAMLGIRSGAVRVRLFRARERFRVLYRSMP